MNDDAMRFRTGWVSGPTAEIEFFGPGADDRGDFCQIKYTPPFHSTIRPPIGKTVVGPKQLDTAISQRLENVVKTMTPRSSGYSDVYAANPVSPDAVKGQLVIIGSQLFTFLLPKQVQRDLQAGGWFLEIGTDDTLLHHPWELMFDGKNYLCLNHALGRFVYSSALPPSMQLGAASPVGSTLKTLSILIICVPQPQSRGDMKYESLPEAENETQAIIESLSAIKGVEISVLKQKDATSDNVYTALTQHEYQIIHYSGHAHFDDEHLYNSSLVLFDQDMTTGQLQATISQNPPILCFINGCETAKPVDTTDLKKRLDIYSLARAFLDTGAYLLGSRWRVNDKAAAEFAKSFYDSLLINRKPIGWAIVDARKACREKVPNDAWGWASYIYYGDPRVCFCMT